MKKIDPKSNTSKSQPQTTPGFTIQGCTFTSNPPGTDSLAAAVQIAKAAEQLGRALEKAADMLHGAPGLVIKQ